jgi:hypothetical protein
VPREILLWKASGQWVRYFTFSKHSLSSNQFKRCFLRFARKRRKYFFKANSSQKCGCSCRNPADQVMPQPFRRWRYPCRPAPQPSLFCRPLASPYFSLFLSTALKSASYLSIRAARFLSKYKPQVPIIAVVNETATARVLQLCRGVIPIVVSGNQKTKLEYSFSIMKRPIFSHKLVAT